MQEYDEILSTWSTDGRYLDWYAIDVYEPVEKGTRRLFVGLKDQVIDKWRSDYSCPQETAPGVFYRMQAIRAVEAKAYFKGSQDSAESGKYLYSTIEAAELLGVSRIRVNQLIYKGKLEAQKVGGRWNVYRHSIESRLEEQKKRRLGG